ncbi:acyltransferase [Nostoc sp. FACHB-892]|uniref:acyltransferase n=1 Tax=Nostoc sp. FACHB-892 TaxID=2692843 RepID=UPI001682A03F|nr:acyltransferase [Nostoc sp. FACHB-892]MBD2730340.1 acyltransferase [Nostoc sp. FACHB-892]
MNKTIKIITKPRLIGIELCRGLAAYAVVVIHASALMGYSDISTDSLTVAITAISRFAVPFFLTVSFYFMTSKIYANVNNFYTSFNLKSKWQRLLIPYLCWSGIYLCFRLIKALSKPDGLATLFQDPVAIFFLGGASIHLYFVPLLFIGSFLITIPKYLIGRKVNIKTLVFLFVSSMIVYELMIVSGNGFQFGSNCLDNPSSCYVSFQALLESALPNAKANQILRLVLVAFSWLIQCFPYVLLAVCLNHSVIQKKINLFNKNHVVYFLLFSIFLSIGWIFDTWNLIYFPRSLYEVGTALCLLIISITLSKSIKENRIIENLGSCSFGIYLMHYLILVIYTTVMDKLAPEFLKISSTFTMVTLATLTFSTSWIITSLILRQKLVSKLLLGN